MRFVRQEVERQEVFAPNRRGNSDPSGPQDDTTESEAVTQDLDDLEQGGVGSFGVGTVFEGVVTVRIEALADGADALQALLGPGVLQLFGDEAEADAEVLVAGRGGVGLGAAKVVVELEEGQECLTTPS